ncbi:thioredoxin [Coralloluteibacterium thermophilus]|uniref:Thioredoxin n=1 Tax=Coralloluteibacterium thermophilum TaxID=2707049 RepID=A0ABV9NH62_9GAMM
MSDSVLHVGDSDFQAQVLESQEPVLVDFWAEWCGPCRIIGPMVDELARTHAGRLKVVKVNVDQNKQTPAQYGIRGIPTLLMFKDGKLAGNLVGAVPKSELVRFVENAL